MDPTGALHDLRDFLRLPVQSIDDLSFRISSTLSALNIHRTSLAPSSITTKDLKAIERYLPAVQGALIQDVLPHFVGILDGDARSSIKALFSPPRQAEGLAIRRTIALSSYLTLPSYLNTPKSGDPSLPKPMRSFLISLLGDLATDYSIDDVYYGIFSSDQTKEGAEGMSRLRWEEALKAAVGIPAKVGNATGRWKIEELDDIEVPPRLLPKPYFDGFVRRFESLLYEVSQESSEDVAPLRQVLEKLASVGLLIAEPGSDLSRVPSLLIPLLPSLLNHLHPEPSVPLPPYPDTFLPSLILPLPSSTLASFTESLLAHLTHHLIAPALPLAPDQPDERVKRAVSVLKSILGEPQVGGEAWEAVTRSVLSGKGKGGMSMDAWKEQARNRLVVGWVAEGGETAAKAFIEVVVDAWTDPKYVKFSMYSQQFRLTHMLLQAFSLLPRYSLWLVQLSYRGRFITSFQSYLSHPDPSIRRLGMVVAEILSELTIVEDDMQVDKSEADEIEELRKGLEVDEDGDGEMLPKKPNGPKKKAESKRLRFHGMWEGTGDGKDECRWLRRGLGVRDADATIGSEWEGWLLGWNDVPQIPLQPEEAPRPRGRIHSKPSRPSSPKTKKPRKPKIVMLDDSQVDDPLSGYASSSPSSSRAPSPTPEYLEEVANDPTLGLDEANRKKVQRPVYIGQLVALLKEREKPECVEMALQWGEGLIRAKREFGTELSENAVAVTLMTLGLNDQFQIEDFDDKRQGILNALASCAPKQAAPFLIEQYFNPQYSLQHKSCILTALAMGARELAGLSVPQASRTTRAIDFPSKTLPPNLHQKYVSAADVPPSRRLEDNSQSQIDQAIDGVRDLILSKGVKKGEETVPEFARERRLRVGEPKRAKVADVNSLAASQMARATRPPPVVPFKAIAAEYFILPLVNRFWHHFQDASIREERALQMGSRFRAAGAGLVLSPMAIEKFLMALALMLDAARHSTVFLSVICPEAMELAVTIGVRHPARPKLSSDSELDDLSRAEAQVLSAALELALVCLDIAVDLDGGRTLAREKSALILAAGEWASEVFKTETEGGEVSAGQGGRNEGKIRAEAAGIIIKVGEIGDKWGNLGMGLGM
ncbi:hypothetical protein B9479_001259 [Cryptococcus floricola]|uniref:Telomere length regulation protein conserved domain-containing protein n=1 Tax=Cryptococcus floricola TaxID=2591691 RepID=A0A5D3B4Y2_9TREE|nr:hypothetical protein B9479_001259 [Cryptococcus floricola]